MTAEFKAPLDVRFLPECQDPSWILLAPLPFYSVVMGRIVEAPEGYITNFVSFEALKNVGQRPSTIHDFLYDCEDVPREIADRVFLEALESVGVNIVLDGAMWLGVRLGGASHRTPTRRLDP